MRDPLTGLVNRKGLSMMGQQIVETARRSGDAVHCVYVDIDQLRHVNEVAGEEAGDDVVVAISDALRSVTRATDIVARWGGDEFCVIGPGPGMSPMELERRLRERVLLNPPVPARRLGAQGLRRGRDARPLGQRHPRHPARQGRPGDVPAPGPATRRTPVPRAAGCRGGAAAELLGVPAANAARCASGKGSCTFWRGRGTLADMQALLLLTEPH